MLDSTKRLDTAHLVLVVLISALGDLRLIFLRLGPDELRWIDGVDEAAALGREGRSPRGAPVTAPGIANHDVRW